VSKSNYFADYFLLCVYFNPGGTMNEPSQLENDLPNANLTEESLAEILPEVPFAYSAILPALGAGLAAALVGGFLWAQIAWYTGYEIGYVAVGIGALCGLAVLKAGKQQKGRPLQILATLTGVLGILFGKYYHFFMIGEQEVAEMGASLSFFSAATFAWFLENLGYMFGPFDALWILFAVSSAWKIPAKEA
jgi:hypothetical protein